MSETGASLSKKLRRLFTEVRREAKRNPHFAARLEAALDAAVTDPDDGPGLLEDPADGAEDGALPTLDVNPVAIARREGLDGLLAALDGLPETALRGLILEHNLDPADEADGLAADGLVDLIARQAARRIERDRKLFDY
jgi:hypothetical protein